MVVWVVRIMLLIAVLTVIYLALAQYSRWIRRKTLEAEFDSSEVKEGGRDEYVARGMAEYERSFSKHLLLGVFAVPIAVVALLLTIAYYT